MPVELCSKGDAAASLLRPVDTQELWTAAAAAAACRDFMLPLLVEPS